MTKSKIIAFDNSAKPDETATAAESTPANDGKSTLNVDIEKTAPRPPDRFNYSGKYKWIKRGRTLTSYSVRFQSKYIDNLDWTPIFVGLLIFIFLIYGMVYIFATYFSPLGIYIVQRNLLGPKSS